MKIPLILAVGLTLASALPSVAQTAAKEADGDTFLSGLGSYQSLQIQYPTIPLTRNVRANECGYLRVRTSTTRPITTASNLSFNGGASFVISSLPVEAAPRCSQGQLSGTNLTPSAQLVTSEGDVYFTGLASFSQHEVTYNDLPTLRNVRANTCGTARISQTDRYSITAGALNIVNREDGSAVLSIPDFAALTTVSGGPICRQGVGYYSTDWP